MAHYRIRFIKRIGDDIGHVHYCTQGIVEIRRARDRGRALEAAKHRFARMRKINRWDTHADALEVEEVQHEHRH